MIVSKQVAAILSVGVSILLTAVKILVGVVTGSLSILADAVDSALDLIAAALTLLVVRVSDLPPDENHPYGHARAENLGSLAQAVLLTATAGLVLWNALERIFFAPVLPIVTVWSFAVIVGSLLINAARIFVLNRAATHHKSETLAANVANFANDMLSSLVVLLALGIIALAPMLPFPSWLILRIDALAAAVVACLGLLLACRIGSRAVRALMDDVPPDLSRTLTECVDSLPDVVPNSTTVRARFVGNQPYVEVTVGMERGRSLEEAHELTHDIEAAIQNELSEASVLVHVEPARTAAEPFATAVYSVAQQLGLRVHNLDLYQLSNELLVKVDLELPGSLTLGEAHIQSERLEAAIYADLPSEARVVVHLEPRRDDVQPAVRYAPLDTHVELTLQKLRDSASIIDIETLLTDRGLVVTIRCHFPDTTPLTTVHERMAGIEHDLHRLLPDVVSVQIDPEISGQPGRTSPQHDPMYLARSKTSEPAPTPTSTTTSSTLAQTEDTQRYEYHL